MYERHKQPLAPRKVYIRRVARNLLLAFGMIVVSLCIGVLGYRFIGGLSWVESYEEAAMILSGMGPTAPIESPIGKIFSGTYALYSGLMLILTMGFMAAPILHRFFHKFHLDVTDRN